MKVNICLVYLVREAGFLVGDWSILRGEVKFPVGEVKYHNI